MKSGQEYPGEVFTAADVDGEEFADVRFEDCIFERCNFREWILRDCALIDCLFSNCTISAPKFLNCSVRGLTFKQSKVIGVDWTSTTVECRKLPTTLTFSGCTIDYSNFSGRILKGLLVTNCTAHDVGFAGADLTDASFEGTDLLRSEFLQTNLTRVNFRGASNYLINPRDNVIKDANFSLPEAASLIRSLGAKVQWD